MQPQNITFDRRSESNRWKIRLFISQTIVVLLTAAYTIWQYYSAHAYLKMHPNVANASMWTAILGGEWSNWIFAHWGMWAIAAYAVVSFVFVEIGVLIAVHSFS